MTFVAGLVVGLALGLIVIAFIAVGSYDRGYEDAELRRRAWRAELVARRAADTSRALARAS